MEVEADPYKAGCSQAPFRKCKAKECDNKSETNVMSQNMMEFSPPLNRALTISRQKVYDNYETVHIRDNAGYGYKYPLPPIYPGCIRNDPSCEEMRYRAHCPISV